MCVGAVLAEHGAGFFQAVLHGFRHGFLETGAEVGFVLIGEDADVFSGFADSGFEAGEGEVAACPALQGSWQVEATGVAAYGVLFDQWPSGITEAQQLCSLVEGFAQRVINGGAEALVVANPAHQLELGVSAGDEQ